VLPVLLFVVPGETRAFAEDVFRVIVNPSVKGSRAPRSVLSSIFLKQSTRWGDGTPVRPVDQSFRAPVREAFTLRVLEKPLLGMQAYWIRRIADGGVPPPPVKSSDEEVIAFVASTPGSIGYVSVSTALPDSVRVLNVID
jgi:ABC-type phosphate transport system substrate-binding protein